MAKKHDLTARDKVALCGYILTDDLLTAYQLVRPSTTATAENQQRQALRWLRQPQSQEYVKDIKAAMYRRAVEQADGDTPDLTDRDNLLRELQRQYQAATEVKTRMDILVRIADITRMKQQNENKADERRIHYYLPVKCGECPYNPKNKTNDK